MRIEEGCQGVRLLRFKGSQKNRDLVI